MVKKNKNSLGNRLIEMGYKPEKWFGDVISHFNNDSSISDALLRSEAEKHYVPPKPTIPLKDKPSPIDFNLSATSEGDVDNVNKVKETMDILLRTPNVKKGAVMPDACPAGSMGTIPVGGVVESEAIHPGMTGSDICCSVFLTNLGNIDPKLVLDIAQQATHFGPGGRDKSSQYTLPTGLKNKFAKNPFTNTQHIENRIHTDLGTQGDGNHFLYVGTLASTGETVIVTHHGSRGVGAALYKSGMKVAEKYRQQLSPETLKANAWIPMDTPDGEAYEEALMLIGEWTMLNHKVLHEKIALGLDCEIQDMFWNQHNFVFRNGNSFIHAKGATAPAIDLMGNNTKLNIVPLNMSEPILLLESKNHDGIIKDFLPHGAGRNFSRSQHIRNLGEHDAEEQMKLETQGLDIRFYSGIPDVSELPSAYKPADIVRAQIKEFDLAIEADHINPYGSIMSGNFPRKW